MAYEKRTWVSGVTKCSAENFNHMESGIETAQKGVDELNTKILYTSDISTISDADYLVIPKMSGYRLINAYNGDRDSAPYARIVAIAKQGDYYVLSFQSTISYTMRIEKIWMKE